MSEPRISSAAGLSPTLGGLQPSGTSARPTSSPRWRDVQFVEFDPATEPPPEPAPPPPEPVAPTLVAAVVLAPFRIPANSNDPLPEPIFAEESEAVFGPEPAFVDRPEDRPFAAERAFADEPVFAEEPALPPKPRAPRYGRAIAPLPPHLIASVPPPPRTSLPPASVKLRPAASTFGRTGMLEGTPFSRRRGGRSLRVAALALVCVTGAAIAYQSDLLASLAGRSNASPAKETVTAAIPAVTPMPAPPPMQVTPPEAPVAQPAAATEPVPPPPAPDRVAALTAQAKGGDTGAEYDLGVIYARGDGVGQDYAKAGSWFREAAINGNVAAQYNLAVLYERGLGLPQNMNEALIWYHSAAARNYPSAQYNLALSYAEGRGTPQDMVSAARWYHRAAEQGVVAAMVNFAILCESGQGTDKSSRMAYGWYHAAALRGDEAAAKRADELYRQFSADDKKAADAVAITVADAIHETLLIPATPGKSAAKSPVQTPG